MDPCLKTFTFLMFTHPIQCQTVLEGWSSLQGLNGFWLTSWHGSLGIRSEHQEFSCIYSRIYWQLWLFQQRDKNWRLVVAFNRNFLTCWFGQIFLLLILIPLWLYESHISKELEGISKQRTLSRRVSAICVFPQWRQRGGILRTLKYLLESWC